MNEILALKTPADSAQERTSAGAQERALRSRAPALQRLKGWAERKFGWFATLVQFGLVGLTGMAVDVLCFWALTTFFALGLARALAIGIAMTWNFLLNRRYTFTNARREPFWQQYLLFCASCMVGALVNWTVSVSLCRSSIWFGQHPVVAAIAGVGVGFVFNFILSRNFVFQPKK